MGALDVVGLLADFDAKLVRERELLEASARNIQILQGHEDEPLRWYADLKFFILQIDLDITTLVAALLRHPNSRLTMEKYLALVIFETESDIGKIANGFQKSLRNPEVVTATSFDGDIVTAALEKFKDALKPMRDDSAFMARLGLVRNTMAGHVWDGRGTRVNSSAMWALSRPAHDASPEAVLLDEFVQHAITVRSALGRLSADLEDSFTLREH